MYHFIDPALGAHVFAHQDPRKDGFDGHVDEGVALVIPKGLNDWQDGDERPGPRLGLSTANPKEYRVFKFERECREQGFQLLGGVWSQVNKWRPKNRPRGAK
jgi:hypothetical protein